MEYLLIYSVLTWWLTILIVTFECLQQEEYGVQCEITLTDFYYTVTAPLTLPLLVGYMLIKYFNEKKQ